MTDADAAPHPPVFGAADRAAAAMAAAVRHNLSSPGSVPPAEQFRLMLADRAAHDLPRPHARAPRNEAAAATTKRRAADVMTEPVPQIGSTWDYQRSRYMARFGRAT